MRFLNVRSGKTALLVLTAVLFAPAAAHAQSEILLYPFMSATPAGKWQIVSDASAPSGRAIRHADQGAAKISAAAASPANYFDMTFQASANTPYRLWIRGKADNDSSYNDSVFVQFSGSVTSGGSSTWRIGTTSATEVNLEECSGCGLAGWVWQDNGWGSGVLGPLVYFSTTGTQKIRVQTREDGLNIEAILLRPEAQPAPAPVAPAPTTATLKVLDWNTHHGVGSDGVYNIQRIANWIAKTGANLVSLNEVEKNSGAWGNEDQPARYAAMLKTATGQTWYHKFAQRDGATIGQGNLILSIFPFEDSDQTTLSYSRSVARVQILVNGIRVNFFSTHLDADSSGRRTTQMNELKSWASGFAQQHIYAGDFNAWPGAGEITNMTAVAHDAWAAAYANGLSIGYAGNTVGNTRNSRIDYIWYDKSASRLVLTAAQVFDVRDSSGVMPSDHRPVLATFKVQ